MTKRALIAAGLTLSLLAVPAAGYSERRGSSESRESTTGTEVTLYEVSERVTFDPDDAGVILRNATSPLLGFAELGTPLCPTMLLALFPQMKRCSVIALGEDKVSTATGRGPVGGKFDIVINAPGNSSVHVPDLPVISGTFSGEIDLSPAVLHHVPLGSITGTFTIPTLDQQGQLTLVEVPFAGTFRLPFGIDDLGRVVKHDDDDETHGAFYLADDMRTLIRIRSKERSIGFPTVRLELRFGQ
jgi:hypothetical protein